MYGIAAAGTGRMMVRDLAKWEAVVMTNNSFRVKDQPEKEVFFF